ncbi:hypothetical protein PR202_gb26022 [Eleusine coracana subsp. coracana]|uniref:NADP-dependent oxidoreductase domain-containing protein n=1 Tax=Eleusine coracana subsp. coracana TaxID=191504 RepID=A0AAV5FQF8_ELECO|nr:hypothetical protein PR202_gb26022 [Eleusine coracana subsp. coracana]
MAAAPVLVPRMNPGWQGMEVSAQGLGCMGMSAFYGPPNPKRDMIMLIHHAIASGVTFLDTSDPHTNEILLGKQALQDGMRENVELATKFGFLFTADGKRDVRGDPALVVHRVFVFCCTSQVTVGRCGGFGSQFMPVGGWELLQRYDSIGELKKLVEERKLKYIGLSKASASASTIRRAHAFHPITAVQLEWSLWSRDVKEDIIPTCRYQNS